MFLNCFWCSYFLTFNSLLVLYQLSVCCLQFFVRCLLLLLYCFRLAINQFFSNSGLLFFCLVIYWRSSCSVLISCWLLLAISFAYVALIVHASCSYWRLLFLLLVVLSTFYYLTIRLTILSAFNLIFTFFYCISRSSIGFLLVPIICYWFPFGFLLNFMFVVVFDWLSIGCLICFRRIVTAFYWWSVWFLMVLVGRRVYFCVCFCRLLSVF